MPPGPAEAREGGFAHSLIAPIWDCLDKAGLATEDLDVLVLHGGSGRNPCARQELKRLLADDSSLFSRTTIVETPNLESSVACGAGWPATGSTNARGTASAAKGATIVMAKGIMKTFVVRLRDKPEMLVEAESYRREAGGEHYVFDGTASGDVEFVVADEVISITVVPPDRSRPVEPEEI